MKYEWITPSWRNHEGLCYFEVGKNKEWKVTVWEATRLGFEITVHFRGAYQVFKGRPLYDRVESLAQAKERGEKIFEEIKSSING